MVAADPKGIPSELYVGEQKPRNATVKFAATTYPTF